MVQVGAAYTDGGRVGVVEQVDSDGSPLVWFGAVRAGDGAHICERFPPPAPPEVDLAALKLARVAEIDAKTDTMIAMGFQFPPGVGEVFGLNPSAQQQLIGAYACRDNENFVYPIKWGSKDGLSHALLSNPVEFEMFYLTAVGTIRYHLDAGQAIKDAVAAATTPEELDQVVDPR